jgi:hypothetical protein
MLTARSRAGGLSCPNESRPPVKLGAAVRRVAQEWAEAVAMFLYAVLSTGNKVRLTSPEVPVFYRGTPADLKNKLLTVPTSSGSTTGNWPPRVLKRSTRKVLFFNLFPSCASLIVPARTTLYFPVQHFLLTVDTSAKREVTVYRKHF